MQWNRFIKNNNLLFCKNNTLKLSYIYVTYVKIKNLISTLNGYYVIIVR